MGRITQEILKRTSRFIDRGSRSVTQTGKEVFQGDHRLTELLRKVRQLEQRLHIHLNHEQERYVLKLFVVLNSKGVRYPTSTLLYISAGLAKLVRFGVDLGALLARSAEQKTKKK